ncbi:MAG: hypothetical protein ACP5H2_10155 [Solirubrobacteraceae bacterium]
MKHLNIKAGALVGLAAVAGIGAALPAASTAAVKHAGTTTTSTTVTAPPVQGRAPKQIAMYVDTVIGAGSTMTGVEAACSITSEFVQGQTVVFRMWGNDGYTGGTPLTQANVASATVTLPVAGGGTQQEALAYGAHGTVAYWTYGWKTSSSTPTGVIPFTITVKTVKVPGVDHHKVGKKHHKHWVWAVKPIPSHTATFSQAGTPPTSQLTINAVA